MFKANDHLNDPFASTLNNLLKYYCNNCNNKKNVYDASGTVSKKSDCPSNNAGSLR